MRTQTEYKARATSDANKLLCLIVAKLDEVGEYAAYWLDSGHGSGCDCPFCSPLFCNSTCTTDGDLAEGDVKGLLYNLRTSVSIISGQVGHCEQNELDQFEAELDAALDTADEPEDSPDCDTPTFA